jgi:hypothetical protein
MNDQRLNKHHPRDEGKVGETGAEPKKLSRAPDEEKENLMLQKFSFLKAKDRKVRGSPSEEFSRKS